MAVFVKRCLLIAATAAILLSATAWADPGLPVDLPKDLLIASPAEVGLISLAYGAPLGTQVDFHERVGDRLKALGLGTPTSPLVSARLRAVRWRCDRVVRRFEATAIAPDGARSQNAFDIRTPSCASRLRLSVPRRVPLGATVRVRVKDEWKTGGLEPRLCITPPRARKACRVLAFPRAVDVAGRQFRATRRGVWRVKLRLGRHRVRAAVAVGGSRYVSPKPLPTVLATGDSLVVGVDFVLADRLARTATVLSDGHGGESISRGLGWLTIAAAQSKKYRPRTTVVFLGDLGYAMQTPDGATHACCDDLWAAEYSRRARAMMKRYIRRGRGHVVWLTVPAPRQPDLAAIAAVQNLALVRAAEGLEGARIVRLDQILTPNGYREYMPYRGQNVRVRQPDGVHLTIAGSAIAADAVEKVIRELPD